MKMLVQRQKLATNKFAIFLPESFEWIILKSGLVNDPNWNAVTLPENHVDSSRFFSWERYFTYLLSDVTKELDYQKYSKHELKEFYLHKNSIQIIKESIKGLKI